ncbi:MAG: Flp pilus assembly protein CpaB [Frankiaceae bacterium]
MGRRLLLLIAAIIVAAFGTTLVFVYVNGVNDRALAGQNPVKILVAKKLIASGTKASDAQAQGALELKEVPKTAVASGALADITPIENQLALTAIYPGQQVLAQLFGAQAPTTDALSIPKGDVAMSVQLTDPGRVAGFVQPGSHVSIFVDLSPVDVVTGKKYPDLARLLLPDVLVLAVGPTTQTTSTTTDNKTGQTTNQQISQAILTVAVNQAQAQRLVLATNHSNALYFALRNSGSQVGPTGPTTLNNMFGTPLFG